MKTLVLFYSYSGKTRKLAEELAKKENAEIIEVKEKNKRSKFNAYVFGSIAAVQRKQAEIMPINCDFSQYGKIIVLVPIWAGRPAPAMNNIINALPAGKEVELIFTSGSGNSKGSAEKTKGLVEARGCKVVKYSDIRAV
ncbi:MAG: hypothetical protein LBV08_02695 [Clostridiales bacterium]|nr:hypothetical protein [Clostridiales bacterium]